jgi:hypothetical protein
MRMRKLRMAHAAHSKREGSEAVTVKRKRNVRDPEVEDRRQLRARGRGDARLTQRAAG